jgi:HAMP domain-containing protein
MTHFSFSSIRIRLLFLVLFAVIPAFGVILYTGLEQRRHDTRMAVQELTYLVRSVARTYQTCFESTLELLSTISKIPLRYDHVDYNALLPDILREHSDRYAGLIIVNRKGDLLQSASDATRRVNFADRDWYQDVVQTKKPAISDLLVGRITGEQGFVVALPALNASGQIEFIAAANLGLFHLGQMLHEIDLPKVITTTLLNRKGRILARNTDAHEWIGMNIEETPIARAALAQKTEATVEMAGEDGVMRLYAFAPVQVKGEIWAYVTMGIPADIAFATAERNLIRNLLWLGLVASLALAAAWCGGFLFIVRPVNLLLNATKQLAAGKLTARTGRAPYGRGELDQLADTFDRMADSLQFQEAERNRAEQARRKSEEHFREVIEDIFRFVPEALLVFTDKLNLFKHNKAFRDIVQEYSGKLNYTEEELTETILKEVKNRITTGDRTEIRIPKKQG